MTTPQDYRYNRLTWAELGGVVEQQPVIWGGWTDIGVHGDPTTATAEKGRVSFEAAVSRLIEVADELRAWPIEQRSDQQTQPVQSDIRW